MKYFDYAATCPLDQEAAELYVKAATDYYGNSQSLHDIGSSSAELLKTCRRTMASILDVEPTGVFFTSGGSESNFLAIHALLSAKRKSGRHIVTGMAEHSSITNVMKKLEEDGYEVTYLPLNSNGLIETRLLEEALREDTVLVSIQHGNPEIGTLQPLNEIGSICRDREILFHSDCVQTFGKTRIKEAASMVDALSLSGHKIYGPKGTGAAYVNPRIGWKPFIPGTSHESGFRPGTVNVPAILALTAAAQKAETVLCEAMEQHLVLRKLFMKGLSPLKSQVTIYGTDEKQQLSGIIGMRIHGLEGQWVMLECNRQGYAISTGSACHTGLLAPSKTMAAMGIEGKQAKEFFRISFGRQTQKEDVSGLSAFLAKTAVQKQI
ncbi:IscS subfamily cysteine desulfurase [Mesobacillus foraminis]|uniref:IscS subfamily cysteine desulfurase n=1 Tax=Mesobacillus foraminis TaxID=279826 RepID=UPI000EF50824|nr:IscS subfamily cysteine desulfurase [Mesobacillus foraminis]